MNINNKGIDKISFNVHNFSFQFNFYHSFLKILFKFRFQIHLNHCLIQNYCFFKLSINHYNFFVLILRIVPLVMY